MQIKEIDNLLINSVIDSRIKNSSQCGFIELIVRPECNQQCEYCYLVQHGDKSYPKETRADKATIIKNIYIFFILLLRKKEFI